MQQPRPDHGLTGVDSGRADFDENVAGSELREIDVADREDLAAAVTVEADGTGAGAANGIASRAGVTERTFFRHFADKREALFDGEGELQQTLTTAIADVPAGLSPSAVLLQAFVSMVPALTQDAELKRRRQVVILATPELRERELAKEARLALCAARALEARGVSGPIAELAAASGIAVLSQARLAWLASTSSDYTRLLTAGYADLRATFD